MALFYKEQLKLILRQIKDDCEKYIQRLPLELTSEEISELWIKPEHRDVLHAAYSIVTDETRTYHTNVKIDVTANTNIFAQAVYGGFLPPNYMPQTYPDKTAPAYESLHSWACEIEETISDFINLQFCVTYLHNKVTDARQLNFFLPSLSFLLREEGDNPLRYYNNRWQYSDKSIFANFKAIRKIILSKRSPLSIPPIPRQVTEACRKADALILRMMMAQNDNKPRVERIGLLPQLSKVPVPQTWVQIYNVHETYAQISLESPDMDRYNYVPDAPAENDDEDEVA